MRISTVGCCVVAYMALIMPAVGQSADGPGRITMNVREPSEVTVARQAQLALDGVCAADGPGAAVLIAKGDRVIFRGARGRAEIELGVPLSADNVFRIASVTKMFTAAMILKLAEAGKLSVDDSLAAYLSDFPNAGSITIRELLNHTSGVSDVVKDPQPGFSRRDVNVNTLVAEIQKRPLDFAPGTRMAYSNAGFILLGAVIEKVTGEPWQVAIEKEILGPLGLRHTQYGASSPLIPGRAAGYSTESRTGIVKNASFISITTPASAGALVSTVDDLRLWMRDLISGQVVGKRSFEQMMTPGPDLPGTRAASRYGLGMYVWKVRGTRMIGHTGQIDGFASAVGYLPERDITVVVLANDDNFDAQTMGRRMAAIALGEPYTDLVPVRAAEGELLSLAGTYQWDENTIETLSVKDGRLYAQRGNRNVIPLQMTAQSELHFAPDELSYFVPVRDVAGAVIGLDYFEGGDPPAKRLPRK